MLEFDYNKFSNLFYTKAFPVLKQLEEDRKRTLSICGFINIVLVIVIIALVWFCIHAFKSFNSKDFENIFQLVIYIPFLVWWIKSIFINRLRKKLKTKLYNDVLKEFELNYSNEKTEIKKAQNSIRKLCSLEKIFLRYDNIVVDDIISGNYKGLDFTLYDTYIYYVVRSGKHSHTVTVFRGVILSTSINKNFKGQTFIRHDLGSSNPQIIGNKTTVRLEDVEFEKLFEVYSTDQIEARYLLTTAFMERLKTYVLEKRLPVEAVFTKKVSEENNAFFLFDTGVNHFEVDVKQSFLDKNNLYEILLEISELLSIVDSLKLDQNIGL